jgi:hypothetical protein
MAQLAHGADLLPAAQLATVAGAYNDLGDHERAAQVLHEALAKVPDPKSVIAFGPVAGSVTGATLGLGESIRSEIAMELYRAGERAEFTRQLALLSMEYQTRTWAELYSEAREHREPVPTMSEALNVLPPEEQMALVNDEALRALASSNGAQARILLGRVLESARSRPASQPRQLLVAAQIARAAEFSDLTAQALAEAGRASSRIPDRGARATESAAVAALAYELAAR